VSVEIRSYRAVFDLERRIYRVDRLRLNPGGVPVRGVVYCLAILAAVALAGALPLLSTVVQALPWYVRDLLLPAASAAMLTIVQVEGRPFHLAAVALLHHFFGAHQLAGLTPAGGGASPRHRFGVPLGCGSPGRMSPGRVPPGRVWCPEDLLVLPDGSDSHPRCLRYSGPGAVRMTADRQVLMLERGAELRVRAHIPSAAGARAAEARAAGAR
jgi:hypothetical protein